MSSVSIVDLNISGVALPLDYLRDLSAFAKSQGLALHMDGARLFNAAVALDVPVSEIGRVLFLSTLTRSVQYVDSVTFCLSKGLCAPAGSILCGSHQFIAEARRKRKVSNFLVGSLNSY